MMSNMDKKNQRADYILLGIGITYIIADYLLRRRKQYTGRHALI